MTKTDLEQISKSLATSVAPNSIRMTTVSHNVTDGIQKGQLAYLGEGLEKKTKRELEKSMSNQRLSNVLLTPVLDGKKRELIITDTNNPPLSKAERKLIKKTFESFSQ